MSGFKAHVVDSWETLQRNEIRLVVARNRHDGTHDYLMDDGTWLTVLDGEAGPRPPGILLPRSSLEVLAEAIAKWQGDASHAATEVRVLREWLDAERARVDDLYRISRHEDVERR
jgi:hypothetical protein